MDFGSLKPVKKMLHYLFDHTLIIAKDDPKKDTLQNLTHVADLRYLPNVGCEKFAETVFNQVESILQMLKNEDQEGAINKTVEVYSVTCFEHAGNSATVKRTRL
jgi:6-pyruvoyltetrahydropterin/6-carboxytetrahydropterin synthase